MPPTPPPKPGRPPVFPLRLDPSLRRRTFDAAHAEKVPMSEFIRKAIEERVKRVEKGAGS